MWQRIKNTNMRYIARLLFRRGTVVCNLCVCGTFSMRRSVCLKCKDCPFGDCDVALWPLLVIWWGVCLAVSRKNRELKACMSTDAFSTFLPWTGCRLSSKKTLRCKYNMRRWWCLLCVSWIVFLLLQKAHSVVEILRTHNSLWMNTENQTEKCCKYLVL